jgi:outer membrane lipoprotein carrier protein
MSPSSLPQARIPRTPFILLLLLVSAGLAAQSTPPSAGQASVGTGQTPGALAKALQQRYQGIKDFTAEFSQSYKGGVLRTRTVEQGTVSVKKPGLMRWEYLKPEKKEFVSDGRKTYLYIPQDRQVIVGDADTDAGSTSSLFLAGKGDITRDFTAAFAPAPIPGTVALKLTPQRRQPDYEYLIIAVDPSTLQIRGLLTHDTQGGDSTLTFTNLKENQGISDKVFAFRIPRGVDVVDNAARN